MDSVKLLFVAKAVFNAVVKYGLSFLTLFLSILSFLDSRKANKVQERLNKIEEKLMIYELEEKELERKEATKAYVEARVMHVSRNSYRLKVWNSGKSTAYKVDFKVPDEPEVIILRNKVPYEFLETGKGFEENMLVHSGTPPKFKIITMWEDDGNQRFSKEQIVSI